jgi:branched-chain amino acid transport system permease protein
VLYSRAGRAMRAVRDDPQLARSLGFSPAAIRTLAFALSGALAGVAGILHAYSFQLVVPELFAIDQALLAVMLIVLAGLGNVWAPVIAGTIYLLLYQVAPIDGDLRAGLLGLVVILVILLLPRGIVDAVPAWRRARAHRAAHHFEEAPA